MISYAYYGFEFGYLQIGCANGAVVSISRVDKAAQGASSALADEAFGQIRAYLDGKRRAFDFPIVLNGTAFQKKVWAALRAIPYGQTRCYGEIAAEIGNPKASRAVGMANNRNPVMIAVPCHRVIGKDGSLVGYGGGLDMKRALLRLEREGTPLSV